MRLVPQTIEGVFELLPDVRCDARGKFVKIFHKDVFEAANLCSDFPEEYYSVSKRRVLRGLHFQNPPHHHAKLVCCLSGTVLDAVVDMRLYSPSYGKHILLELSFEKANMLYISPGFAHGFYVLSRSATLLYKTSTVYSPENDAGVLWNTAGIQWPDSAPIISDRDSRLPSFCDFTTKFNERGKK